MTPEKMAERLTTERAFADTFAATLSAESLNRWYACRSNHRIMAFEQKRVWAFRLVEGQPKVLNQLTCEGMALDVRKGLVSHWRDMKDRPVIIGHTPVEVAEHCFMWHGMFNSVEYPDHRGKHKARISVLWRTQSNFDTHIEGHSYLLEETAYKALAGS